MKRHLLLSLAALAAAFAFSASAADIPSRKATPVYAAPAPMWTGFYAGLNAGGTWTENNNAQIYYSSVYSDPRNNAANIVSNIASLLSSYSVPTNSASGFFGGAQIGFNNIIKTNYLIGLEADFQGTSNSHTRSPISLQLLSFIFYSNALQRNTPDRLSNLVTAYKKVAALGTALIRFGYLITPTILLCGTGGFAYGLSNCNTFAVQDVVSAITDEIGPGGSGNSVFRPGWTAGGGAEWMLMNNWSIKAEYLYYDLGETSLYLGQGIGVQRIQTPTSGIPPGQISQLRNAYSNLHFTGNIVRAGVNYHFNWDAAPVVAKY